MSGRIGLLIGHRSASSTRAAVVALLMGVLVLTGCSATAHKAQGATTSNAASASSSPADGLGGGAGETVTAPRSTVVTTPRPTLADRDGSEIDAPCPYATADEFRGAEGDRVGRVVELKGTPAGCRFYFQYDPSVIVGEIRLQRFGTPTEAFNAVVTAANGHPEFVDDKTIGDGGSISIRLPLQGQQTWACIFSKGDYVVTAQSRQTVVGQDARNIARLIESRIP